MLSRNARTDFYYSVGSDGYVLLGIFDCLGREVIRLVDEHASAGRHDVVWNVANGIPAGTYFVTLRAGSVSLTRTIVLVK